jgi:hypothetical protein
MKEMRMVRKVPKMRITGKVLKKWKYCKYVEWSEQVSG